MIEGCDYAFWAQVTCKYSEWRGLVIVMDMVIFRTIFFELLVFFTFALLTLHFAY